MSNRKRRQVKKTNMDFKKIGAAIGIALFFFAIFYLIDTPSTSETVVTTFEARDASSEIKTQPERKLKASEVANKKNLRLPQIEVLNGCGVSNITGMYSDFLTANKIDVIHTGNYSDFLQTKSFIMYHTEAIESRARQLADQLSITDIRPAIMKIPTHELTLVLGADYGQLTQKVLDQ